MDRRAIRLIGARLCLDFVNTVDPCEGLEARRYDARRRSGRTAP